MIKKLILVSLFALYGAIANAETLSLTDTLAKLPGLKQGVAYSLADSKINYLTTLDIMQWKGISLEAGFAADAENTGHKIVAVVSYDFINLKKLGVTVPVLDLIDIRLGVYGGFGQINIGDAPAMRGNNELDYGVSATAITVKF